MRSKIESARIAKDAGIETWILSGREENFLVKALDEELVKSRVV